MKKFLKKALLELIGVVLIGTAVLTYHELKNVDMAGLERFAIVFACAFAGTFGMKVIQRAAKCEK